MTGYGLETDRGGEEVGEKGVFDSCIVDQGEIEVKEGCFNVVPMLAIFGNVRRKRGLVRLP